MSLKQLAIIIAIIIVGVGVSFSARGLNTVYFLPFSWVLFFKLISGPVLTIIFLPKKYWLRMHIFIFTFAGLAGLSQITVNFTLLYLLGINLKHSVNLYIYQGVASSIFVSVFFIWLAFDKRNNRGE